MNDDIVRNPYFRSETSSEDSVHGQAKSEEAIAHGMFVRTNQTGDKVYYIHNGEAHWVKNPQTLEALGGNFDKIVTISHLELRKLVTSVDPIDLSNVSQYVNKEVKESVPLETFETPLPQPVSQEVVASAPGKEPKKGFTSIIIPAYLNSYSIFHYTGNCIGSVREHTDKEKTPYEIIFIINGATDIKFDNLQQTKAHKIIRNEENKGYATAVNQGIRVAQGEYICILNNDTMVFNHWLEDMQEALDSLDLVMATPMYGKPFARAVESEELRKETLQKPIQETFSDFKDFSCVLTRKEMFDQIGLFDEKFFMYGEDLDLIRRMDKENLKHASTKRVNITHIIGGTSNSISETPEIMNESKAILKEKWGY